jgi:protein-S-isoprenylcysteine O-methyltransferase Ste14
VTSTDLVSWIGLSHLLQPPLTAFLASARGLDLASELSGRTPIAAEVLYNMGFASVVLPTALGLIVAVHAEEVSRPGAARTVAVLAASFWTWRLYRQMRALEPRWPTAPRLVARSNLLLKLIFFVQGPVFAFSILVAVR